MGFTTFLVIDPVALPMSGDPPPSMEPGRIKRSRLGFLHLFPVVDSLTRAVLFKHPTATGTSCLARGPTRLVESLFLHRLHGVTIGQL
jgi:hypothetical protein